MVCTFGFDQWRSLISTGGTTMSKIPNWPPVRGGIAATYPNYAIHAQMPFSKIRHSESNIIYAVIFVLSLLKLIFQNSSCFRGISQPCSS